LGKGSQMNGRTVVAAAVLSAAATFFTSGVAAAGAQPPGNHNWITLDGTCAGQPVTLLDPRGGNTGFVVGGSVGVGKTFRFIDTATNTVILEVVTGRGIDPDRLVTCEFPLGNGVLIVVEALITPQGP
jgi:hypothetical protein